jgi:hypothetical protein
MKSERRGCAAWERKSSPALPSDPAETRCPGAVEVECAADLYTQGWTLRQISAELDLSATTVSQQLPRAGVTTRRGVPPRPGSRQRIVELSERA